MASAALAQAPIAAEQLLAAEITPGTTALLVEHATRADVQSALGDRLRHPRPDVRAAATRVILAMGARGLLPQLVEALGTERVPDAAIEMTRAVATLGGPAHDEAIVASWPQLGPDAMGAAAVTFARMRGLAALQTLPQLRALNPPRRHVGAFIEATQPDAARLDRLLDDALAANDVGLYRATLIASQTVRLPVAPGRLAAGLGVDRLPAMRFEAARAVLTTWDGASPLAPPIVAALGADAPYGDANDIEIAVVHELTARMAGRRRPANAVWLAQVETPGPFLAGLAFKPGVEGLLTPQEMRQLRRALPNFERSRRSGPPADLTSRTPMPLQLLDSYPAGFLTAVLAATGCDVRKAGREGVGAGAGEITMRADGRSARVMPIDTGGRQAGCAYATRVLLITHVADVLPKADERRIAVVPFDEDYLTCRETQDGTLSGAESTASGQFTAPEKVRHVNPIYPETAQRGGVQGVVILESTIGTGGCVGRLTVLRGVDPRLDLAALLAVMRWRFAPSRVDGAPVPVIMTVTVSFTLR